LEVTVSVLVTTTDGYHIFTSKGQHLTALGGQRVESLTPGPAGTWLAVVDRRAIWQHGADGEWTPLAKADVDLTAVVTAGSSIFAGTADARVLALSDGGVLDPLRAFETVPGRDEWHQVGSPLQVRSMTATSDGSALLVNVHVGGIPRSVDRGRTWSPTIAVDDDVHQVLAHPTRPEIVVAAASVGLCRSADGGATWTSTTDGMALTYARGVAIHGDTVLVTVSDGPRASRAAVYRASVDGGPVERVEGGLPEWLRGNVDTRCIASDGRRAALVDGHGDVWSAPDGLDGWEQIASELRGVTAVAIA
jgi:hypothetical protein